MNKFKITELSEIQQNRLAAQRQLYSKAKKIRAVQMGVVALSPLILALFVAFLCWSPAYTALYVVTVTVLRIWWWVPIRESSQTKAAKIQELFDCEVLQLNWRKTLGSRLEMETVEAYAGAYRRKAKKEDLSSLEEWYPKEVEKLPVWIGRIIYQRTNCWWDANLRRRYAWVVIIVLCFVFLLEVILCLMSREWGLERKILLIVNPFLPTLVEGVYECKESWATAKRCDELKDCSQRLWDNAFTGSDPAQLTCDSRELQDAIYNHRRSSLVIFDWVYKSLRRKYEELMNIAAHEMVSDAQNYLKNKNEI